MTDNADHILIFASGEAEDTSHEVRRGFRDTMKSASAKASEVAVDTLQENMSRFLRSLDTIISASPKEVGGLTLDEVEIHAQIDSKGNVGISAIAGAEIASQGGIKLVLRRKV